MTSIKSLIILLIFAIVSCSGVKQFSKSGETEKQFISSFIELWMVDPVQEVMKEYMSKEYFSINNIKIEDYLINTYSPKGYKIENYNSENGEIELVIWGADKEWAHRLYFNLKIENKKLCIMPTEHKGEYMDPWTKAESWIKDFE